jgi:hypothetical protein
MRFQHVADFHSKLLQLRIERFELQVRRGAESGRRSLDTPSEAAPNRPQRSPPDRTRSSWRCHAGKVRSACGSAAALAVRPAPLPPSVRTLWGAQEAVSDRSRRPARSYPPALSGHTTCRSGCRDDQKVLELCSRLRNFCGIGLVPLEGALFEGIGQFDPSANQALKGKTGNSPQDHLTRTERPGQVVSQHLWAAKPACKYL